jgi:hypothetical protein
MVTFTPIGWGALTPTPPVLNVQVNGTALPLTLTGTGVQALFLGPSTLPFSYQGVNVSSTLTVTLYNFSGSAIAAGAITIPGSTGPFTTAPGTCANGVANSSSCTFTVTFTPTTTGAVTPSPVLNVQVNGTTLPLTLSGTGVPRLYLATNGLPASTLAFGNEAVGGTSFPPQTVSLFNFSGSTIAASAITIPGSAGPFTTDLGTCMFGVTNKSSCYFGVMFTPTAKGPVTPSPVLDVMVNGTMLPLTLSGTGE